MGEVGTRRWAARHGADVIVQSRRGAGMSRVRRAASASEDGRRAGFGELQRHGNNIVCMHVRLACACVHACVLYVSLDRRRESKRD